jgi:hypothetical protein
MRELGRTQVTRLIAFTLWEQRGGDEENPGDWYDAEVVNNDLFWDDLRAVMEKGSAEAGQRALHHIIFHAEELVRVMRVPENVPIDLKAVLMPLSIEKDTVLAGCHFELEPTAISLGIETGLTFPCPMEFRLLSADVTPLSFLDQSGNALDQVKALGTVPVRWEGKGEPVLRLQVPDTITRLGVRLGINARIAIRRTPASGYPVLSGLPEKSSEADLAVETKCFFTIAR